MDVRFANMIRRFLVRKPSIQHLRYEGSYDGPGKTTISVLNKDPNMGLLINAYSNVGFRLNNGVRALGPIILFPKSIFSWKITEPKEINRDSLTLFAVIEPKLDLLIIGMGDASDTKLSQEEVKAIRDRGTNIEILPTSKAVGYYNFLASEGRHVAVALMPPQFIDFNENDLFQTKKSEKFFETSQVI